MAEICEASCACTSTSPTLAVTSAPLLIVASSVPFVSLCEKPTPMEIDVAVAPIAPASEAAAVSELMVLVLSAVTLTL